MIETPDGSVPIEKLEPGDLVLTRDNGPQPISWVGKRTVTGQGNFAPIRIKKGALGNSRDLLVSPLHRMLVTGAQAELLFGELEVLVAAKHLVNGDTIFADPCDEITYHHIMFDAHELITAENCVGESYFPGDTTLSALEDETREELFELYPELRDTPQVYGDTVRPCVKGALGKTLASN